MPHPGIPVHGWTERGGRVYRAGLTGRGPGWRRKYISFSTHNSRKTCRSEEHYNRHGTWSYNCYSTNTLLHKKWVWIKRVYHDLEHIFCLMCNCVHCFTFVFQVSKLLRGDYDDVIGSYQIIDCRYPYEYEGGHVKVCSALCSVSLSIWSYSLCHYQRI